MIFKEMDPDDVWRVLSGHSNVIAEEVKKTEEYFSKLSCTYCGGNCHAVVNNEKLFDDGSILPNFIAECSDCGAQFTPYTKIEVKGPNRNPLEDD